jgi:hypothetical protein
LLLAITNSIRAAGHFQSVVCDTPARVTLGGTFFLTPPRIVAFLLRNRNCKSWYLGTYENGRQRMRSLKTESREEAEKLCAEANAGHVRPTRKGCIDWRKIDLAQLGELRAKTTPGRRNVALAKRAYTILHDEPEKFGWLLEKPRQALLAELGHIPIPEFLKMVAAEVCTLRLRTVAGRIFIKRSSERCRKVPPLHEAIARAIEKHLELWPDACPPSIAAVLQALALDYQNRERIAA